MSENEKLVEWLHALATRLQYDGTGMYGVETIADIRKAATALTLAQARMRELETALAFYACDAANCDCLPGEEQSDRVACGFNARQALKEANE